MLIKNVKWILTILEVRKSKSKKQNMQIGVPFFALSREALLQSDQLRGKRGSGVVSVSLSQIPLLAYFLYYSRKYRQLNVNMGYNGHLEGVS